MGVILAIDGGGSRTRCLAISQDGQILGAGTAGPSNHLLVAKQVVCESLRSAIMRSITQAGINADEVACVSAGLAGVDIDGNGADEMEDQVRDLGFTKTFISGDLEIAHAGALSGQPGVVALAGTGSSVIGIGDDQRKVKVGGWGPIFGDEGSAQRIGQSALRAAARDFDGRGPKTKLTAAIVSTLGLRNFQQSLEAVYLAHMQARDIARLSETVDAAARAGDEVAMGILDTAGAELAESVGAAIRRLGRCDEKIKVSYQGSVIVLCESVRESFGVNLKRDFPFADIAPPRFPPVVGAYLLGRSALGHPNDDGLLVALEHGIDDQHFK